MNSSWVCVGIVVTTDKYYIFFWGGGRIAVINDK